MDNSSLAGLQTAQAGTSAQYVVHGSLCTQLLSRLINLLSQQDLVPVLVAMRRDHDSISAEIVQDGLDEGRAVLIAEKMRSIVTVSTVTLRFIPAPRP